MHPLLRSTNPNTNLNPPFSPRRAPMKVFGTKMVAGGGGGGSLNLSLTLGWPHDSAEQSSGNESGINVQVNSKAIVAVVDLTSEEDIQCKYCGRKFVNRRAWGGHQNAHREERAKENPEKRRRVVQRKNKKTSSTSPTPSWAGGGAAAGIIVLNNITPLACYNPNASGGGGASSRTTGNGGNGAAAAASGSGNMVLNLTPLAIYNPNAISGNTVSNATSTDPIASFGRNSSGMEYSATTTSNRMASLRVIQRSSSMIGKPHPAACVQGSCCQNRAAVPTMPNSSSGPRSSYDEELRAAYLRKMWHQFYGKRMINNPAACIW